MTIEAIKALKREINTCICDDPICRAETNAFSKAWNQAIDAVLALLEGKAVVDETRINLDGFKYRFTTHDPAAQKGGG